MQDLLNRSVKESVSLPVMRDRIGTRAAKGDLLVKPFYVDVDDPEQRGFYSVVELEQRGWTNHMIRTLLKPDRIRKNLRDRTRPRKGKNRAYRCSPWEYEYSREQVSAVAAKPEWQKAKARADRKVERACARSKPSVQTENKLPDSRFSALSALTPSPTRKELMASPPPVAPGSDSAKGRLDKRMRQRFRNIDRTVAKEAKE